MGDLSLRVFILAGEASGDALGAALVKELRVLAPDIQIAGVAGPLMQAEGVESLYSMDELSVMGIAEVLPRYFHLLRRLRQTATACSKFRPHALITIDSPDFSLRLAKLAKRLVPELHAIHYVAPSVWAWRPGRAAHMAQVIDQVLALLPFEPPYMERAGMRCDFVGHPVVAEPVASDAEVAEFRAAQDIGEAPLCLVLPGSRKSEIARLGPVFGETIAKIHAHRSDVKFLLPMAHGVVDMV
ncbi:MAG: lipid-A-disaccharide synthase, partial [Mangrovicoccus sp.]